MVDSKDVLYCLNFVKMSVFKRLHDLIYVTLSLSTLHSDTYSSLRKVLVKDHSA